MDRTGKKAAVASLKEEFDKSLAVFLTQYRGINVPDVTELRAEVTKSKGHYKVIKNRLAKIAAKGTQFEELSEQFSGPNGIAFVYEDPVAVAKALVEATGKEKPFKIIGGNLRGKMVDVPSIEALSKLPDRETLLSMALSAIQGPIRNFAQVVAAVPRDFVTVLNAVKEQKES